MDELKYYLEQIFADDVVRVIISNPRMKSEPGIRSLPRKSRMAGRLHLIHKSRCFMRM